MRRQVQSSSDRTPYPMECSCGAIAILYPLVDEYGGIEAWLCEECYWK